MVDCQGDFIGRKIYRKLKNSVRYFWWRMKNEPNSKSLHMQRMRLFKQNPLLSLVSPLYNTPPDFLRDLIRSIQVQTYSNFELILVDASDHGELAEIVGAFNDDRIVYQRLDGNKGISENTNCAVALAAGEYIGFIDHDDMLAPNALFEVVSALDAEPDADLLYSDEDNFSNGMCSRRTPFFKPDYAPTYLLGLNYICHFLVVKKSLLEHVGRLNRQFDGAQDYEFILRASWLATKIVHLPQILYHWRVHNQSVSKNFMQKSYAQDAAMMALKDFVQEKYLPSHMSVSACKIPGRYSIGYHLTPEKVISVVLICQKESDLADMGKEPIARSAFIKEMLPVCAEKCSTIDALDRLFRKAIEQAQGDYLFFLSNQVLPDDRFQPNDILGILRDDGVGAVGCMITDKTGSRIYSNGMYTRDGYLRHSMHGGRSGERGYFDMGSLPHEVSAVSGWGMLTRKTLLLQTLQAKPNWMACLQDASYCFELRDKGKRIVMNPSSRMRFFKAYNRRYFAPQPINKINYHLPEQYLRAEARGFF